MRLYKVKGHSMHPLLRDNDFVVVTDVVPKSLRRGNILVYRRSDGEYVVHRFIKRGRGDTLCVKGDGYNLPLELTSPGFVIGKAIGFIRNRRYKILNRQRELHSWFVSFFKERTKLFLRLVFRAG